MYLLTHSCQPQTKRVKLLFTWGSYNFYLKIEIIQSATILTEVISKLLWLFTFSSISFYYLLKGWNKIRSEVTKKDLADVLKQLRSVAVGAATQSKAMKDAVVAIDKFLSKIRYANYQATFDLQRELLKGLTGLKYTLECYRNMIQATSYIIKHCKKGNAQFSTLWDQTILHFSLNSRGCKDTSGVPYTTKSKMEEAIKAQAKVDNFNPDCILNSKDIRYLVCARKYKGYSVTDIAKEFKLTVKQAATIVPHCPPEPLTPHKVNSICRLHKDGVAIDDIVGVLKVAFVKVAKVLVQNCTHTQGLFGK